jgi:hypothetical protein
MKRTGIALTAAVALALVGVSPAPAADIKPPGPCQKVSELFETANIQGPDLPDTPVDVGDVCAATG